MEWHFDGLDQLAGVAKEIIRSAGDYRVWCFNGQLGAGKTTLIKAVCQHLEVTDTVSSPTFSIINEYQSITGLPVYHFDFYRLKDEHEALDIGVEEYFYSGHWCFIEWGERVASMIPELHLRLQINVTGATSRSILMTAYGKREQ